MSNSEYTITLSGQPELWTTYGEQHRWPSILAGIKAGLAETFPGVKVRVDYAQACPVKVSGPDERQRLQMASAASAFC